MTRVLYVDPGPARAHIQRHLAVGRSLRQLARQAKVHNSVLSRLVTGKTDCTDIWVANRILTTPVPQRLTDTGSMRRIDALARRGWSIPDIAHRLGIGVRRLQEARRLRHFSDATARALAAGYPALANTWGGDWWVSGRALRAGKLPPWAWQLDTIDDPTAEPDLRHTRQGPEPATLARALTERPLWSAAYHRAMTGLEPLRDVAA